MYRSFKLLPAALLFFAAVPALAEQPVNIKVNNTSVMAEQPPIIENGRTLVPLRAIFESLGAAVEWDDPSKTVTASRSDTSISLTIGADTALVNGAEAALDAPAKIVNDSTLVPVRFIAESFGCYVGWQDSTKTVFIADGADMPCRDLTVHFLDVGQADSILIQLPNNENMLIDAGKNSSGEFVTGYISALGIDTLDYVVGTHPHEDHIGGLDDVIDCFNVEKLYMPTVQADTATYRDVLESVSASSLTITPAKAGTEIYNSNGIQIEIIAPVSAQYDDLNNYSAVIHMTFLDSDFLFMGDAEELVENELTADIDTDVLKVGHHGSDSSTSYSFLERATPEYAVISVGANNSYGHPSNIVIDRLQSFGATVFRTDIDGTIIISSDGNSITVPSARNTANETVYITKTGAMYHRENCGYLGSSKIPVSLSEARKKYLPCSRCDPPL